MKNQSRHREDRDDLAGEHRLGDAIQMVLLVIFSLIWVTDSFIFHYSDTLNQSIPISIRLVIGLGILVLAGVMARSTLNMVFGEVRETPQVIREGFFKYCRHPMYLSAILLYIGILCLHLSISGLVFLVLIIGFYYFIARHEEKLLSDKYGADYKKYKQEVRMWIPIKKAG